MKKVSYLALAVFLASPLSIGAQATGINANVNATVGGVEVKAEAQAKDSKQNEATSSSSNRSKSTSTVSASASQIRGWDDEEKQEFLATVKAHAELKSGQDLENFAKGVMLKDENVSAVEADEETVEVRYKLPAKFLGIFEAEISAITDVTFESDKSGRGPKEVTVKFPWYARLFSLDSSIRAEILQSAIDQSVEANAQVPRDNHYAQNGRTINLVSAILKGIRAKLDTKIEAEESATIE